MVCTKALLVLLINVRCHIFAYTKSALHKTNLILQDCAVGEAQFSPFHIPFSSIVCTSLLVFCIPNAICVDPENSFRFGETDACFLFLQQQRAYILFTRSKARQNMPKKHQLITQTVQNSSEHIKLAYHLLWRNANYSRYEKHFTMMSGNKTMVKKTSDSAWQLRRKGSLGTGNRRFCRFVAHCAPCAVRAVWCMQTQGRILTRGDALLFGSIFSLFSGAQRLVLNFRLIHPWSVGHDVPADGLLGVCGKHCSAVYLGHHLQSKGVDWWMVGGWMAIEKCRTKANT